MTGGVGSGAPTENGSGVTVTPPLPIPGRRSPAAATGGQARPARDPPLPDEERAARAAAGQRAAGGERLGRPSALGVLSPDCISSSAYGTEEMLTQLVPYVGLAAFALVVPVTMAILGVLFFVTLSYLEVIQLYTKAGGSYVVARENFGPKVAQIAAVALMIDYTVTVAVQTSAGTAALTSAFPALLHLKLTVPITVAVVLLLLYGNLRGIREAGKFFAFPTYFFIFSLGLVVVSRLREEGPGRADASTPSRPPPRPTRRCTSASPAPACSTGPRSSSSCAPSPTEGPR